MASEGPVPRREEIRNQLARILASQRFKAARNPAAILELVVTRALDGKKTSEAIIGRKIFGPKFKKDESTDVRVTAVSLREKLDLYSKNEGSDDPVTILLPKPPKDRRVVLPMGEAYTPIFAYNRHSEIAREYVSGLFHLRPAAPFKINLAIEHFMKVLDLQPGHIEAGIGLAEAGLLYALLNPSAYGNEAIASAVKEAERAAELDPTNWHAHAALGAACFLSFDQPSAEQAFDKALKLDKASTSSYGWFHAFLFSVDNARLALSLAQTRAGLDPTDTFPKAIYGFFLYLDRQFDAAREVFVQALLIDHNCWASRLGIVLVELAAGKPQEALLHHKLLQAAILNTEDDYLFPGLAAICLRSAKAGRADMIFKKVKLVIDSKKFIPWSQSALTAFAFDNLEYAYIALSKAWTDRDPIFAFLPHLPLIERWRKLESFGGVFEPMFRWSSIAVNNGWNPIECVKDLSIYGPSILRSLPFNGS
jgi:tetratricopeptide (TPR) repeat protein